MVEATPTRLSCSGAAMVKLCTEVLDEHKGPAPTVGIPSTERPNVAHWSGGLVGPS